MKTGSSETLKSKVQQYINAVVDDTIPAGRYQRLAVERHLKDLLEGEKRGLHFDEEAAARAIEFIESYLTHSKGEWAGQPFLLAPWEAFILWVIFGWKRKGGTRRYRIAYIEVARKNGKALAVDTPIPTPSGWTVMGDLRVGDSVFDSSGKPCRVLAATEVMERPSYRVLFSDRTEIVADAEHLWRTRRRVGTGNPNGKRRPDELLWTTEEIANSLTFDNRRVEWNHSIGVAGPLDLPDEDLPIPAYALGFWLGDGEAASARVTVAYKDAEVLDFIRADGVEIREYQTPSKSCGLYRLGNGDRSQAARDDSVQSRLRELGILGNKQIPMLYLRASIEQRTRLLQGLMDSDGYASKAGQCEFTTTSRSLRDDFLELARSLGYKPSIKEARATLNGVDCGPKYRVQFWGYQDKPVFRLRRKVERLKPRPEKPTRTTRRQVVGAEPVGIQRARCIQVDSPDGMYLAGAGMVPTHNSTLAAGIGLYLTIADEEPGADVYSAATKKDQARIVHGEAIRMVKKSKRLSRFVVTNKNVISVSKTDSTYEPLSKDKDTMDGLNVHGAIIDELHAHKDRGVWDVLVTAVGSRRQPLIFTITTAGFDRETVCWEQHDYSEKILDGLLEDDSHFAFIAAIDEDDDWLDETNWHKANPNLEVSVSLEDMREQANKARQTPAYENAFRRLKLCQWTTQESRWLKTDDWAATAYGTTGLEISVDDLAKSVVGLKCCAGLDLASTTDIAALALVFRMDDWYAVLPYFWVPEDRVIERRSERVSYQNWVDRGYLMTTPGNVIDYAFIKEKVLELGKIYRIQEIAYDRWGATELVQSLEDKGYEMVPFGQGYASMSSPTKELLNLVLARKLIHANHPVLKWMAGNLAVTMDSAGNVKPAKDKSTDKIDGMVAMTMGIDRASRHDWNKKSVYADRGFASL